MCEYDDPAIHGATAKWLMYAPASQRFQAEQKTRKCFCFTSKNKKEMFNKTYWGYKWYLKKILTPIVKHVGSIIMV